MQPETALPPIAPAPADMPQATKDAARSLYEKAGYDAEQLTAAGYGQAVSAAPAPPVNAPTIISNPGSTVHAVVPSDGLTHEQNVAGFKAALMFAPDPTAVVAAAEAVGITRAELEYTAPDAAEVAAAERDAATAGAFAVPATPNDYSLIYPQEDASALDPGELQDFDATTRQAFHSAGVPASLANGLLSSLIETAKLYADMPDAARELRFREEGALLKKLSADADEEARLANFAYGRLPASFREMIDEEHAMHSARAMTAMAAVGRAIEYRERKK